MPWSLEQLLSLPALWLVVMLSLLLIRRKVLAWAERRAVLSTSALDERAVALLARLYVPAGLLGGAYFTLQVVPVQPRWQILGERVLSGLALLLAVWVAWRGFSLLLHYWAETNPNANALVPPAELVGRILLAALGVAMVLSGLGYSLTKVWAALGIGSLAIALALQETLSNTFAGFHLMLDKPFRVGDYVKLDSGEEGWVTRISWRSTWLRTRPHNLVAIPNSKLARAAITNYSLPDPRMALMITIAVSYDCDPRRVREVLEEVARQAVREVEGLLPDPQPLVRFLPGFGDYSLNFTLICQVTDYLARDAAQDELHYRIFERLKREGIEIPFQVRELFVTKREETRPAEPSPE